MATVTPTITNSIGNQDGSMVLVTWVLTSANADGTYFEWPEWADKCFTATGTWGGATLTIQGSNDGTNPLPLNLASSGAATASADKAMQIIENTRYVRPNLTTPGAGATVTVILCARRASSMRT